MTKKGREREKEIAILAHSIAEQAASVDGITYSEAIMVLERAKAVLTKNMEGQQATVSPEIRDWWGVIIGMSGTEVPD